MYRKKFSTSRKVARLSGSSRNPTTYHDPSHVRRYKVTEISPPLSLPPSFPFLFSASALSHLDRSWYFAIPTRDADRYFPSADKRDSQGFSACRLSSRSPPGDIWRIECERLLSNYLEASIPSKQWILRGLIWIERIGEILGWEFCTGENLRNEINYCALAR